MSKPNHPAKKSGQKSLSFERLEPRVLLAAPVITSLEDSPDQVPIYDASLPDNQQLVLTARGVSDPDGSVCPARHLVHAAPQERKEGWAKGPCLLKPNILTVRIGHPESAALGQVSCIVKVGLIPEYRVIGWKRNGEPEPWDHCQDKNQE